MKAFALKRALHRAGSAVGFGLACLLVSAPDVQAQGISAAEQLLFESNHLKGLNAPASLHYSYRQEAPGEAGFEDEARVDVAAINANRTASVSVRFLSGERNVPIPPIEDAHGNPALLGFLERDIAEMKRRTGGSTMYFRKRIRMALAHAQEPKPVSFTWAGAPRQGREVRIQPYLDDPLRDRFPDFQRKTYRFVLSNDVPGGLYQIQTDSGGGEKPGIRETLTLLNGSR